MKNIQSLNGSWKLSSPAWEYVMDAQVPGSVLNTLLKEDKVSDPY